MAVSQCLNKDTEHLQKVLEAVVVDLVWAVSVSTAIDHQEALKVSR